MNDDEIGKLVCKGLADGTLPRQIPGIARDVVPGQPTQILMTGGGPDHPCAVCGRRPTKYRYGDPLRPGLAFDDLCHTIWLEKIGPRRQ